MKIYKHHEITPDFIRICREINEHWESLIIEEHEKLKGKTGSCVIGNGFYVYMIPARCRKARRLFITNGGGALTGSLPAEKFVPLIKEMFKAHGIECEYGWGRLD